MSESTLERASKSAYDILTQDGPVELITLADGAVFAAQSLNEGNSVYEQRLYMLVGERLMLKMVRCAISPAAVADLAAWAKTELETERTERANEISEIEKTLNSRRLALGWLENALKDLLWRTK